MRHTAALAALLLVLAVPAGAQIKITPGDGGGVSGGTQGGASISTTPSLQTSFITYTFQNPPNTSASTSGWFLQQSTASGVTFTATSPQLIATGANDNRRALAWEIGAKQAPFAATKAEEVSVVFSITGAGSAGFNEMFQFTVGDTTNFLVNKKPDGFGVLVVGATKEVAGAAPNNGQWVAFVGNGSDSTYVTMANATGNDKIWIHANPSAGAVDFYINDVFQTSIASPVRSSNSDTRGIAMWFNGDTNDTPAWSVGPIAIQRQWH